MTIDVKELKEAIAYYSGHAAQSSNLNLLIKAASAYAASRGRGRHRLRAFGPLAPASNCNEGHEQLSKWWKENRGQILWMAVLAGLSALAVWADRAHT